MLLLWWLEIFVNELVSLPLDEIHSFSSLSEYLSQSLETRLLRFTCVFKSFSSPVNGIATSPKTETTTLPGLWSIDEAVVNL